MRRLMIAAALAALLAACQPPSQQQAEAPEAPGPQIPRCNDVLPNLQLARTVQPETAVAAVASDLRGGRIAPGTYDLASATRLGDARGWDGARAVALDVTENPNGGTVLNWVSAPAGGGDADRWTASLSDTQQQPRVTYTCGRTGEVDADFTAQGNALTLRLPDGANGSLQMSFQRRT